MRTKRKSRINRPVETSMPSLSVECVKTTSATDAHTRKVSKRSHLISRFRGKKKTGKSASTRMQNSRKKT
eukprot:3422145-Alexandrium_andersonii.AAC.1